MSIKELRLQNGWSQEYLAELSNLSSRTIQRIEKENKASLESLNALAKAFELEVSQLQTLIEQNSDEEINEVKNNNIPSTSFFDFLKQDKGVIRYLLVNLLLIVINLIINPKVLWFIYPLLGWGIPLFYGRYKKYYL